MPSSSSTPEVTHLGARFILTPGGVLSDAAITIDADGRIAAIHPTPHPQAVDLGDVILAPGGVNAHSHAFQRVIRGRTEHLAAGRTQESFWTWRDLMYRAANALDADAIAAVSAMAFLEMVRAGVTAVGEFHYLHHTLTPEADPLTVDAAVIDAARQVGLRVALLRVAYQRAGSNRPALPEQRRFVEPDVATFLSRAEALAARFADDAQVSVGLAPHSVRAVDRAWLEAIAAHARQHDRVLHIHACEQRRELEECVDEHGIGPVELLARTGMLGPRTTLVHATHLDDVAHRAIADADALVCACPTTERNLGDGFLPAERLIADGVRVCLGSDSQAQIDLFCEARLIEYHARLQAERRNVLARHAAPSADGSLATADVLWPMIARNGAQSLGVDAGEIRVGAWADLMTVDLTHPTLIGAQPGALTAHLVFDTPPGAVRDVFVAGQAVMRGGIVPGQAGIIARYRDAVARLG